MSGRHGALETWWHHYSPEDWAKADGLLARAGVEEIRDRPFGVISEGERQHVLLARALMSDPELVLLDEPFAGLDLGRSGAAAGAVAAFATAPGGSADRPGHPSLRGDPAGLHPWGPHVPRLGCWRRARWKAS